MTTSTRAHRRNIRRYRNLSSKFDSLEHLLGGDAANFLGVHRLENWYSQKWDAEVEAMIRSGNLVRLQFPVTNLVIRREEVAGEWFRLPEHSEGDVEIMGVDAVSNLVTIICRPKYTPYLWHVVSVAISRFLIKAESGGSGTAYAPRDNAARSGTHPWSANPLCSFPCAFRSRSCLRPTNQ